MTFKSHTNLGTTNNKPLSESIEYMSLSRGSIGTAALALASALKPLAAPKPCHRVRGKGNQADQFYIYRTSDGQNIPALAIKYKAPHKLSVNKVITGLELEI